MNIGILGSGTVGQVLGDKLAGLGHDVVLGTRTPDDLDRQRGQAATLRAWLDQAGDSARVAGLAETADHGAVVINAVAGQGSLDALAEAGAANLAGKILMDITNPLDFSGGFPPALFVCNDDSLGELIQDAYPDTHVVKTLNTTNATIMVDPGKLAGGDHTIFVSGDDADAKARVAGWLKEWFGWRDVVDLGGIGTARGVEMFLALWTRLYGALGSAEFNIKVVR